MLPRAILPSWVIAVLLIGACGGSRPAVSPPEPPSTTGAPAADEAAPDQAAPHQAPPAPDWASVHPAPPSSFEAAKKRALDVYRDHRTTLYCGCTYDEKKAVEPDACGYRPRSDGVRARRIEWEHMVPASAFGRHRACWTEKLCTHGSGKAYAGRACCGKPGVDDEFRRMEADLQNLAPAIGELNADRSDRPYGEVDGEPRRYGACDFEVDLERNVAEPAEAIRGDVARATLYMHFAYGADALPLSREQLAALWQWHRQDPPDAWERERNERIRAVQGVGNPLIAP